MLGQRGVWESWGRGVVVVKGWDQQECWRQVVMLLERCWNVAADFLESGLSAESSCGKIFVGTWLE